jgi:DNA-binding NarL/FixJ family response regulator
VRRVIFYGLLGGALITLLKVVEYQHFVRVYPSETYGGLIAAVFAALGIHLGRRLRRTQETALIVKEVPGPATAATASPPPAPGTAFVVDAARLRELGITPREHEILGLIAAGLSNREIGERVFISENTVKTHSSRLFDKLGVNRRVQAVQRARQLGLVP